MRRVLLLLALAACSSPTGPDQADLTNQIDEVATPAQSGNVADYELHIVKNRGADNPYTGATLTAGTYWVRLERKDDQWDGIKPNSRLSPGVDSVVFVIDGTKTRERLHPYEATPVTWSDGSHSVKWTLYGYSKTSQTLTVQVGSGGSPAPEPEPTPEPTPTPTPDPTPDPTPTPDPGSYDIVVKPGQSIQSAVNSNPAGTKFLIKSGTHYGQQVTPKNDQKFYGESGTVMDGQDSKEFAFGGHGGVGARVLVKGIEIKNYRPRDKEFGAIQGDNTVDWIVRENNVHHIRGVGIRLGPRMKVIGNHTHDNDNAGIGGFRAHGSLIEGNKIEHNGHNGVPGSYAGLKMVVGRDVVLRNNEVFDNAGRGLWLDTAIFDVLIEGNYVHDNEKEGIWLEIVCGATVRNNRADRNGLAGPQQVYWPDKAGIQVVNGTNVSITGNSLKGNLNAIALLGPTGYPNGECKPDLRHITVSGNDITLGNGFTGAAMHWSDTSIYNTLKFQNNTYTGAKSGSFIWKGKRMSVQEWKAAGNDVNGTFN